MPSLGQLLPEIPSNEKAHRVPREKLINTCNSQRPHPRTQSEVPTRHREEQSASAQNSTIRSVLGTEQRTGRRDNHQLSARRPPSALHVASVVVDSASVARSALSDPSWLPDASRQRFTKQGNTEVRRVGSKSIEKWRVLEIDTVCTSWRVWSWGSIKVSGVGTSGLKKGELGEKCLGWCLTLPLEKSGRWSLLWSRAPPRHGPLGCPGQPVVKRR